MDNTLALPPPSPPKKRLNRLMMPIYLRFTYIKKKQIGNLFLNGSIYGRQ